MSARSPGTLLGVDIIASSGSPGLAGSPGPAGSRDGTGWRDGAGSGDWGSAYGTGEGPLAVAHRGGAGLGPQNALAALSRAHAFGLRYLAVDVWVGADGGCVAFQGADARRFTTIAGQVAGWSASRPQELRAAGEPVVRLEQVLEAFPDAYWMIDLKDPRAIGPLAALLRRMGVAHRVCIGGGRDLWLADVRAVLGPQVRTAMGWESMARLVLAARTGRPSRRVVAAPFVHVPLRMGRLPVFADPLVSMAHDLGARVLVSTVNDPVLMGRLLDRGVDGIITDRPDLLREVLVARGRWAPPVAGLGVVGSRGAEKWR